MNEQLQNFYRDEVDRRHLNFEAHPDYNAFMEQSLSLFPDGDLPKAIFQLIETSNCISFAHGLKLGLRLNRWAAREKAPLAKELSAEG